MSDDRYHIQAACEEMLRTCAVNNLRKLTRLTTSRFNEKIKRTGMKTTQMCVLMVIGQDQGRPMNIYADQLGMDLSTLARGVDTLAANGLVTLKPGNRRERLLFLTEDAKQKIDEVYPLWQEAQNEFLEAFGQTQWEEYLEAMQKSELSAA